MNGTAAAASSSTQQQNINDFSQTSKSLTQSKQYVESSMDSTLINKKIEECIQYILYCTLAEKRAIVKRADINKNILKDHTRAFLAIMVKVKSHLVKVFGLDLVDIDGKQDKFGIKTRFQFDSKINKFKVQETTRTNLELLKQRHNESFSQMTRQSTNDVDEMPEEELHTYCKYSLLMISLSLIFMNNNELDATEFWANMKRISINRNEKRNPFIGDVEKYFTQELVKDGYLEYELIRGTDPPTYKFKWGYRSKLEITKMSVLEFVCKMYGTCKPSDWNIQFEEAKNDNECDVINDMNGSQ
jgi:hypothetical protein